MPQQANISDREVTHSLQAGFFVFPIYGNGMQDMQIAIKATLFCECLNDLISFYP